ncbi:MAG TPA: XdhC family protein [Candidatus Polarisedimenticolaceae bacterium]|nr:XdhC family protein [Candidatus Polarisedimenticolaceae bacterium]
MRTREIAAAWAAEGCRIAQATVVRTWRSSPCPAGSLMVVDERGRFAGSVSGGCIESAVIEEASRLIERGGSRSLEYGVTDERAWEVGLPCGGEVEILVGPFDRGVNDRLLAARTERSSSALLIDLSTGVQRLVDPDELPGDLAEPEREFVTRHAHRERCGVVDGRTFVQILGPPVRLILIGAVHLGQMVARLARLVGFEVSVVDPRPPFATPDRFPDARLVTKWPAEALAELGLDRRTAVVTLSHDAKLDEPALATALAAGCFYVGALGGRKTQQARRQRLRREGIDSAALARIHGPVGLDIGAVTAGEIAVAIVAQIVERWRRGGDER